MAIRTLSKTACVCICLLSLVGCAQDKSEVSMQPPSRPAELDLLNGWVGRWEGTGEMKNPDGTWTSAKGTSECSWDLERRVLVERATFEIPQMGTMTSLGVYAYDPASGRFISDYHNSMGEYGHGKMRYNADTRTWKMKAKGVNMEGKPSFGKGTIRMVDDNTMEWTWAEYDPMGLFKKMEMKGTMKRTGA